MKIAISIFFGLIIFFISPKSNAQQYHDKSFYLVDSLAENAKPKEALALVESIYAQANKTGNTNLSVKAAIYSMLFQTYLAEDALVVIINRLKTDITKSKQPEKSLLQSVLGSIYWNYYLQNRYRISQRSFIENNLDDNVKTWSIVRLNQEISNILLKSVHEKKPLQPMGLKLKNSFIYKAQPPNAMCLCHLIRVIH